MDSHEAVVISIVTHNSEKIFLSLDALLRSLGEQTNFQLKIFDNASEESYCEKLSEYLKYPFVKITFHQENEGFGFGHNANLLESEYAYGIIFNPDIILKDNELNDLVALLKAHPECALLAPKIVNDDGTTQHVVRDHLDVFDFLLRFLPFRFVKKLFQRRLARFECRDLPQDSDSYVRMISGSFMVADLGKFREVAGFDNRYFMYFEDNDLCRKMEEQGYKILYSPRFQVTHLYERGAVKSRKLFFIFLRSMGKYFQKWGWHFF